MASIKFIQFFNHYIFKNQIFDFTIDGINPVKNVIIAGENGSGKTKLLEELYNVNFLINNGFIISSSDYIKIPEDKIYVSNEILINFLEE